DRFKRSSFFAGAKTNASSSGDQAITCEVRGIFAEHVVVDGRRNVLFMEDVRLFEQYGRFLGRADAEN
ncbi:MAG: hypothetical protein ABR514_00260, partial [Chthoniobacterales bacterium]